MKEFMAQVEEYLEAQGIDTAKVKILCGDSAARHHEKFDADWQAILVSWTEDEHQDLYEYAYPAEASIWTRLLGYLESRGIKKSWYDYLDELAVVLYFEEDPYGPEGRKKNETRIVALPDTIRKTLTGHLMQAKVYAEEAIACVDDRGPSNFDHVCLALQNYPAKEIEAIFEKIGLHCTKEGNHLHPEFHISAIRKYGDNTRNTIFCKKFVEYFNPLGYEVRVIYILD